MQFEIMGACEESICEQLKSEKIIILQESKFGQMDVKLENVEMNIEGFSNNEH